MSADALKDYVRSRTRPHMLDVLHQIGCEFGCDEQWIRPACGGLPEERLTAAPLPVNLRQSEMLKDGQCYASATAALGESTWRFDTRWGVRQGQDEGVIGLATGMDVVLGVKKGRPQEISLSSGQQRDGFLCFADDYILPGGLECHRIEIHAGWLWLRPEGRVGSIFEALWRYGNKSRPQGRQVIHAAHSDCGGRWLADYQQQGYLRGYTSQDKAGRKWVVQRVQTTFTGTCRLHVAQGGYPRSIDRRTHCTLEPPYEAVWQPHGGQTFVPLRLN